LLLVKSEFVSNVPHNDNDNHTTLLLLIVMIIMID